MTNPLVSIIIPVYNAATYLNACLDSVLAQSYSNIEVILVNDGSTDKSEEICNAFKQKDGRVKVIHLENQGVSHARNIGIEQSSGQYLCFIDSDDIVESDYIKDFTDSLEEGVFIYIQGTQIVRKDSSIDIVSYKEYGVQYIDSIFSINNLCRHGYACCKLYESSFIKGNQIDFNIDIKFSEDLLFILKCLFYTDRIKYIAKANYYYFLREEGASSKRYPFEMELKCWKFYIDYLSVLSGKYHVYLLNINSVGAILGMLFSRIRNTLYKENYPKNVRLNFYHSLSDEEMSYVYKFSYVSNWAVRFGYYLGRYFNFNMMDCYFSIIYR